jgi:hypothetical protein
VALLALTGCGGGGGGVPDKVTVDTDADAIAYYDAADGVWKTDVGAGESLDNGLTRYTIDKSGAYDVALFCRTWKKLYLFSMNTKSDPYIRATCPHLSLTKNFNGSVSDNTTGGADGYAVAMGLTHQLITSSQGTYQVTGLNLEPNDLLAASFKNINGNYTPQRFFIERFPANYLGSTYDITFTEQNSYPVSGKTVTVSSGSEGNVVLISENGTYFTTMLNGEWFYPASGLTERDTYVLKSSADNGKRIRLESHKATEMPLENVTLDATYIAPLTQESYSNSGSLSGLTQYTASQGSQKLRGMLFALTESNLHAEIYLMISKSRLEDTFDIPDMSGVQGFANSWDGTGATEVHATAVMSDVSLSTMMRSGRYYGFDDTHIFFVQDAIIETAEKQLQ